MNKIKFPDPKNKNKFFYYQNQYFTRGKIKKKILEYNNNLSGWSDKLTFMHEKILSKYHPIDLYSRENLINNLKLDKKKTILEIGCSNGWLIDDLIKKNKDVKYIGSDVVYKPLKKLSKKFLNVPFLRFDITQNPLNKIKFDNVIMINVLEHIKNDELAIQQVFKLLKKNGRFFIEVPANQYLYDNYDKELKHFRRYKMSDLVNKLMKFGFTIEKKQHLGFFAFFPFLIIKLYNKIFRRKKIAKKQIAFSNNFALKFLIKIEKKLSNFYFPLGIRCFLIAKKN